MHQFTNEQIQAAFERLPKEVRDAVTSPEIHDTLISLAKKYGLHIDQEGELVDQVGLVMLGLSPSKSFVAKLSENAGIRTDIAQSLADDINDKIFTSIKQSMRSIEEDTARASLETAGNFTIDKTTPDVVEPAPFTATDTITAIENPPKAIPTAPAPVITTEPLVDHLLSQPVIKVEQKIESKPVTPKIDPYREAI